MVERKLDLEFEGIEIEVLPDVEEVISHDGWRRNQATDELPRITISGRARLLSAPGHVRDQGGRLSSIRTARVTVVYEG